MDVGSRDSETRSCEVYTIGHSNSSAEKIIGLLKTYNVQALVDVRSFPYSQYAPQFNREAFAENLRLSGIEYGFGGDSLGGHPKDPTCYKDSRRGRKKVNYREISRRPWFQKAIARLVEAASERRTAIMCSEENPSQCHRHQLIAQILSGMNVKVWHIRGQGTLEDAKSLPFSESVATHELNLEKF